MATVSATSRTVPLSLPEKGYEMQFSSTTTWVTSHLFAEQTNLSPRSCSSVQLYSLERGLLTNTPSLSSQPALVNTVQTKPSAVNGSNTRKNTSLHVSWTYCLVLLQIEVSHPLQMSELPVLLLSFPHLWTFQNTQSFHQDRRRLFSLQSSLLLHSPLPQGCLHPESMDKKEKAEYWVIFPDFLKKQPQCELQKVQTWVCDKE